MPNYQEIHNKKYQDDIEYRAALQPNGNATRSITEVIPFLPQKATILEIGAGPGKNIIPLLEIGCRVTAEDISEIALDDLRKNTQKYGDQIRIIHSIEHNHTSIEIYDCCIITYVLHFMTIHDAEYTLQEAKKSIKPGGFLVLEGFDSDNANAIEDGFFPNNSFIETYFPDWHIIKSYKYKKDTSIRANMSRFVYILQKM